MIDKDAVNAILPQTQCGLCGYGGCKPYAKALCEDNAAINLCPPGGVETLKEIGRLLGKDATPYLDEMANKAKPPMIAKIRESECIGCTKCISACPVDAIIGSAKRMHVVLTDYCTGCELCIPPCPVDCIDMITIDTISKENKDGKRKLYRQLFERRETRLEKDKMKEEVVNISSKVNLQSLIDAALNRAKKL